MFSLSLYLKRAVWAIQLEVLEITGPHRDYIFSLAVMTHYFYLLGCEIMLEQASALQGILSYITDKPFTYRNTIYLRVILSSTLAPGMTK